MTGRSSADSWTPTRGIPFLVAILAATARVGAADFGMLYAWRTWIFGWMVRVIAQVLFFAGFGTLVGNPHVRTFLLIGSCASIAIVEALMVVHSSTWDRFSGAYPLVVASRAPTAIVITGRSVQWVVSGSVSSSIAFLVLEVATGSALAFRQIVETIAMLPVVAAAAYCFGLALAALVQRRLGLRPLIGGAAWFGLSLLVGVYFPVSTLPHIVADVSAFLPTTHAIGAIRIVTGQAGGSITVNLLFEALVSMAWLSAAIIALQRFAAHGRHDGTLDQLR